MKENQGISTCNCPDLQITRICPKKLPNYGEGREAGCPMTPAGQRGWWQPHPPPPAIPSIAAG